MWEVTHAEPRIPAETAEVRDFARAVEGVPVGARHPERPPTQAWEPARDEQPPRGRGPTKGHLPIRALAVEGCARPAWEARGWESAYMGAHRVEGGRVGRLPGTLSAFSPGPAAPRPSWDGGSPLTNPWDTSQPDPRDTRVKGGIKQASIAQRLRARLGSRCHNRPRGAVLFLNPPTASEAAHWDLSHRRRERPHCAGPNRQRAQWEPAQAGGLSQYAVS